MENTQHIYVALDSDVLRSLVFRDILLRNNPKYDFRLCEDFMLNANAKYFNYIVQKAKSGEIRFLILPTVYHENKHSESIVEFMKTYCYFPNINVENYIHKCQNREMLAQLYCAPYIKDGVQYPAPMIKTYNAHLDKIIPNNDAYIMAETTLENAILLTNNTKHFVYDEKSSSSINARSIGIMSINVENGFYSLNQNNKIIIPKPISLAVFGAICSGKKSNAPLDFIMSDDYTKTRDPFNLQ